MNIVFNYGHVAVSSTLDNLSPDLTELPAKWETRQPHSDNQQSCFIGIFKNGASGEQWKDELSHFIL